MKRRTFIKSGSAGALILLTPATLLKACSKSSTASSIDDAFLNPPDSAKARTWWHWMNGNVTSEGITLDMEAMKQVGIGGFQIFDVGSGMVKGPVDYHGDEWLDLKEHAAREAERLGLRFEMHNCPGWSSSGGPWVTPELSMQYMVWSEAFIEGGQTVDIKLPQPYTKHGYYRDAMVLAFPSIQGEEESLQDLIVSAVSSDGPADKTLFTNYDMATGVEVSPAGAGRRSYLQLEMSAPVDSRSVILFGSMIGLQSTADVRTPTGSIALEYSQDGTNYTKLCDVSLGGGSRRGGIESPGLGNYSTVSAKFYRLSSDVGFRVSHLQLTQGRLANWDSKSGMTQNRGGFGGDSAQTGETDIEIPAGSVIDPETVIDITSQMDDQGRLTWDAPEGNWTIIRFGQTPTGITNNAAPTDGEGLECDKFSREAFKFHFDKMFDELLPSLEVLAEQGMVGALVDSYEVGAQNWTVEFPQQFMQYRNYDLVKYMPAMTGRIVGSRDISERFLYDIRKTCADSLADNYYKYFTEVCNEHGMIAYTEPYGAPCDEIQAGSQVDVPMGEYWIRQGISDDRTIKLAASIAHITDNGNQVVGAEAYTGHPQNSRWLECPYMMKAQGDYMYTKGLNQFIFHRYAMQPHPTAAPGMTMGPWGFHFDRTNTWFPKATGWLDYVSRCQNMLRTGTFVADVVQFIGEERPVRAPETDSMGLNEGYDFDNVDTGTILEQMSVRDGRIVLNSGMSYRVLVLTNEATMTFELLSKIADLVNQGACVIGPRPVSSPSLESYLNNEDDRINEIAGQVWGNIDGEQTTENIYGKGKVVWGQSVPEVLNGLGVKPDFEYTSSNPDPAISYIHRNADGNDFYFVTNSRRRPEDLVCTFRVNGRMPELWDAVSGKMTPATIYELTDDSRVRMPLHLDNSDSIFVVFRSSASEQQIHSIMKDNSLVMGTQLLPGHQRGRYGNISNSFTISLWAKPEIDTALLGGGSDRRGGGNNFAVYPPGGELLYGAGHAACGLSVGRNGVAVFEKTGNNPTIAVVAETPIAGWSHVAVVYNNGTPAVYVDGQMINRGSKSASVVHPAINEAYMDEEAVYYEGDISSLELMAEPLGDSQIRAIAAAGIPDTEEPPAIELFSGTTEGSGLVYWQEGNYMLNDNNGGSESIVVEDLDEPAEITGAWTVSFPSGLGAPAEITMDKLTSLHRHNEDGVKYFSGTATYSNTFNVSAGSIGDGKRLFLDLGRVEVLAEVNINGRNMGLFWKPPYRIDITDAVTEGDNQIEVQVTNLWPNRLIGDEHIPTDYVYGGDPSGGFAGSDGCISEIPDWFLNGGEQPGERISFTVWRHFTKDDPLLESGLTGPVKLRKAYVQNLNA